MGADKFQLIAGPYLGLFVDGKTKIEDSETKKLIKKQSISIKTLDLGGIGMEIEAMIVRIQYGYGLTNIGVGGSSSDNNKNRVIGISIGCMFGGRY